MIRAGRDTIEVEALVTDRYLEALLAGRDGGSVEAAAFGFGGDSLDRGVRLASLRLRRDLPRFHPSFRFEERLALRLAEAAASLRLARAAGGEADVVPFVPRPPGLEDLDDLAALVGPGADRPLLDRARPLLLRGAVASAAISLAGAAWVAWRRSRVGASGAGRVARVARDAAAGLPGGTPEGQA